MENTILPGEFILINKLYFGARLYINRTTDKEIRAPGYSKIKNNDVIVFNFPEGDTIYKNKPFLNYHFISRAVGYKKARQDTIINGSLVNQPVDDRQPYVKRCIGIPGDTICIYNNAVFVNDINIIDPIGCWKSVKDSLGSEAFGYLKDKFQPLKKDSDWCNYFFPHYTHEIWNYNNYGPLYIPKKGDTIILNMDNLSIYYRIITLYEHNYLIIKNNKIYINNKITNKYILKQNYYFMMGDNYWNSVDSRVWGFVPENHIIGKAVIIIWSIDKNGWFKFRKNRIFRVV